ncbi:MAG TPA: phosphopantetheine-binding protein [Candidatus Dormibacteraeota bacterium]|nr:phosphopantetheine-binding protein [Candidatus Dormibacteraeota bacterium]
MRDSLLGDVPLHNSDPPVESCAGTFANRTSTKQQLASMLADLLGLERVEDDDNFFMLGGHSLLGTQLIMRIRDTFGVDISLRTIFTQPTVAGIAEEVDRLLGS